MTRVLSDHGVNIILLAPFPREPIVWPLANSVEMADPQHLNTLLAAVRRLKVYSMYRITGAKDSAEPAYAKSDTISAVAT